MFNYIIILIESIKNILYTTEIDVKKNVTVFIYSFFDRLEERFKSKIFSSIILFNLGCSLIVISNLNDIIIDYNNNEINNLNLFHKFIILNWPYNTIFLWIFPILLSTLIYSKTYPKITNFISYLICAILEIRVIYYDIYLFIIKLYFEKKIIYNNLNILLFDNKYFKVFEKIDEFEFKKRLDIIWKNIIEKNIENLNSIKKEQIEYINSLKNEKIEYFYKLYSKNLINIDKIDEKINIDLLELKKKNFENINDSYIYSNKNFFNSYIYDPLSFLINKSINLIHKGGCWLLYTKEGNIILIISASCITVYGIYNYYWVKGSVLSALLKTSNENHHTDLDINKNTKDVLNNLNNIVELHQNNINELNKEISSIKDHTNNITLTSSYSNALISNQLVTSTDKLNNITNKLISDQVTISTVIKNLHDNQKSLQDQINTIIAKIPFLAP